MLHRLNKVGPYLALVNGWSVPSWRSHEALPAEGRPGLSDDDDDNDDDDNDDDDYDDDDNNDDDNHRMQLTWWNYIDADTSWKLFS